MYKEIPAVPNLPEYEAKIIENWKKINIIDLLKKERLNAEEKVYYDGPITANNTPHYGHAITWTLKDIVPRYWSMKGYYVSRNMGWDCQGLLVEIEVEKTLGFKEKDDIEKYGIEKFNQACKESVFKYRDAIYEYETRMGRWIDDDDTYYTMNPSFIESIWWSFKELYEKGLIYEGLKVVPYSTRAGCPLSHHEVADGGYKEVTDPSIVVKFKLLDEDDTYALAWTTTPWTIPGNLLLAIGKKVKYVKVSCDGEKYILAATRVEEIFKGKECKVLGEINHSDLVGKKYEPPFEYFIDKRDEGCFKIVYAHHANDEDGTGIVHLAPYGEDDFDVFMKKNIKIFDYLDEEAHFTDLIPEYSGLFYKKANKVILEDLEKKDRLYSSDEASHRVPICYRTKTPLIYRPIKSWYLGVTEIKDRMLEENDTVHWVPEHIKNGMSKMWISGARDWAISRARYWGTPMPVWINDKTGEMYVAGSFAEIEKKTGKKIEDPHKPFIDEYTWEDPKGGTFRRIPDVLDVWYDSGAVPFAKLHYPFENKDIFDVKVPADYIAEATDQIRLWFYTMHILGVALFDKIPYRNVVSNGLMLAKNGEKLSKSKKNFEPMEVVLDKYGADILRMFILTSPMVQGENARFSAEALDETKKEFFLPLWNSLRYFITYANLHEFSPTLDYPEVYNTLDRWILARLNETVINVTKYMDDYHFMDASRQFAPLVQDLSTWYIRRSRDRIKNGDVEALDTLYYVLTQISRLITPMTPFMAEKIYEVLGVSKLTGLKSVHLDLYPEERDITNEDIKLIQNMADDRDLVTKILSIRVNEEMPVKQVLSSVVTTQKPNYTEIITNEVNVKEIKKVKSIKKYITDKKYALDESQTVGLNTHLTPQLKLERDKREMVRKIQSLRKKHNLAVTEQIEVTYKVTPQTKKVIKNYSEEIKTEVYAKSIKPGDAYSIRKL